MSFLLDQQQELKIDEILKIIMNSEALEILKINYAPNSISDIIEGARFHQKYKAAIQSTDPTYEDYEAEKTKLEARKLFRNRHIESLSLSGDCLLLLSYLFLTAEEKDVNYRLLDLEESNQLAENFKQIAHEMTIEFSQNPIMRYCMDHLMNIAIPALQQHGALPEINHDLAVSIDLLPLAYLSGSNESALIAAEKMSTVPPGDSDRSPLSITGFHIFKENKLLLSLSSTYINPMEERVIDFSIQKRYFEIIENLSS